MIMVRLSRADEIVAHTAGLARESTYGSNPKFQGNKGNFHNAVVIHSEAAGAEIAVARYLGIEDFTPTINTFKNEPDINWDGVAIEVKQTPHRNGHFIVSNDDRDSDMGILVVGESPTYYIAGWIPVGVAKRSRFASSSGGWWVSQVNLQPIENLLKSHHAPASI